MAIRKRPRRLNKTKIDWQEQDGVDWKAMISYFGSSINFHLCHLNHLSSFNFFEVGFGCRTVLELTPRNEEVVGLNLSGCWAFFFFFYLFLLSWTCRVSLIRSPKEVHL